MPSTFCPGRQWTTVSLITDKETLIRPNGGAWITTDGTQPMGNLRDTYPMANGEAMVLSEGLVLNVYPASPHGCHMLTMAV